MRRVLSAVVAIALIGSAYLYRTRDGEGSDGGRRSSDGPLTLVCTTELAEICQAVEDADSDVQLRVEPAWRTVDRLLEPRPDVPDAWLAAGPWPQLVDEERDRRNLTPLFDSTVALGASPLIAVIDTQKLAQLPCGPQPSWACLASSATAAGSQPRLRLGMPDPSEEAAGTLVVAAVVGSAVDNAEFSRGDFEGLPSESLAAGTTDAVEAVARSGGSSSLIFFGGSGGAFLDAWAATKAELEPTLEVAVRRPALTVIEPSPRAIVTATLGSTGNDVDRELFEELLAESGWAEPPPEAGEDGLPSPGVLIALSELFR